MEPVFFLIIFAAGFFGSFIGAMAGGAALVIIPALIFVGLTPHAAIATSKVGILGMALVGWNSFHRAGKVNYKVAGPLAIVFLIGALLGSLLLLELPTSFLKQAIGIIIVAVLVLVVLKRDVGVQTVEKVSCSHQYIGYILFFVAGVIDSAVGVGAGIIAGYTLLLAFGQTFLQSAGVRLIARLLGTIIAFFMFARAGIIEWGVGSLLLISMIFGSYVGSHYGIKKGDAWIRWLFVFVVFISALKILL